MQKDKTWTADVKKTVTPTKHLLANISIRVRTDQFKIFEDLLKPNSASKVLDVGVDSHEILKDSNMFEKLYKHPRNLTAVTIEDEKKLRKLYPKIRTKKIYRKKKLPFKNKSFDIVVSWATLEHVGSYKDQEFFLKELVRVGKKVFVTTPYRGAVYEPHTGFFFLHWLPFRLFRKFCGIAGKKFWAEEENLNPLYVRDLKEMRLPKKIKFNIYNTFGILPSHILITIS